MNMYCDAKKYTSGFCVCEYNNLDKKTCASWIEKDKEPSEKITFNLIMLYHNAIYDKEFRDAMWESDRIKTPINNADEREKQLFAIIYYGWLIAKHGKKWSDQLKHDA